VRLSPDDALCLCVHKAALIHRQETIVPSKRSTTGFLNVDLDISVRSGLDELLQAMGRRVLVLHNTGWQASVELAGNTVSLDQTMLKLAKLVTSLPEEARDIWERCRYRRMNIGIQAGRGTPLGGVCLVTESDFGAGDSSG
jgi:hypothetical protein